ncbi:MAG: methyl-coenzyme M reductase I operon protein C [Candidatus Verstraetearchaeota archaeon]|nr:methyl-coenzyme M reductase I operon protein C [Candidatus Verstraetearchaeota archaeon]
MSLQRYIGRELCIIDCRETMGAGLGGGLAQRGTIAEADRFDVVAIAMSPHRRHITRPICEITYGLREQGIRTSVLVLASGSGTPQDAPVGAAPGGSSCGITEKEIMQLRRFKLAIIHLGAVAYHIVYKARTFLRYVDLPAIIVCQAPVDFEDFAKVGVNTIAVKPKKVETAGIVVDVVTGVIRAHHIPRVKLEEVVQKVKYWLNMVDTLGKERIVGMSSSA